MDLRSSNELEHLSARDIAAKIRRRDVSAVEVFDAVTARIERYGEALNAIVRFDPAIGRAQAVAVDRRPADAEALPLLGVPFTVKDCLWVGGLPATQGSQLFRNFVAPRDSWCVARMRALGAVFVGATNCPEFAAKGVTDNLLYGKTRNPWDPTRTPGGSSGGAASAVASGFGALALGTDAGGSIRRPAAHCGVVGMKPTLGIIPDPHGFVDASLGLSTVGPLARNVEDAALMLESLLGYDPADPLSVPFRGDSRIGRVIVEAPRTSLRIAFSSDLGCDFRCDADVLDTIKTAVARLQSAGYRVTDADVNWPAFLPTYPELACEHAGLAALYGDGLNGLRSAEFDPVVRDQVAAGFGKTGVEIATAFLQRREIHASLAHFFAQFDLLLCPTTPVTAWPLDEDFPRVIGGRPAGPRGHAAFTPLFNICGVPACSVPAGFVNGLPVGLQIVGPRFEDARVLQMARLIEQLLALSLRPPLPTSRADARAATRMRTPEPAARPTRWDG